MSTLQLVQRPGAKPDAGRSTQAPAAEERGGPEAAELKAQLITGDLTGLRAYLARTRAAADWQERIYLLELVIEELRPEILDFACDVEPGAADLFVARCAYFVRRAMHLRGTGTCESLGDGRMSSVARCIQAALVDMDRAVQLDPRDPTAPACILPVLTIFTELRPKQQTMFEHVRAVAPDLVPAWRAMVTAASQRWGGSHEQSLKLAREAMAAARPGSDMAACLFWAHSLAQSHYEIFEKYLKAAAQYTQDPAIQTELNAAFDAWTASLTAARPSTRRYLEDTIAWYESVEDRERLGRAYTLAGIAAPKMVAPHILCFGAVVQSVNYGRDKQFKESIAAAMVAAQAAKSAPPVQSKQLMPLALFTLALACERMQRKAEAMEAREKAMALLDAGDANMESGEYQRLMANVLDRLGEYKPALPFFEGALRLSDADSDTDPMSRAGLLHDMGLCYHRIGLEEHAVVPLRAAVEMYSAQPDDPRFAAALLNYGNALRRSAPEEAERVYKQAADLHLARMQYLSATPAWVNLAVLYSEQGRHAEAVELNERVLRVREQTPGTPANKIASAHNSLANAYRRMRRFKEAHAATDRCLKLVPAGDALVASAYGTRGEIYLDAAEYDKAAEWLRKASAARQKQPSPNLRTEAEDLEREITALTHLGRHKEIVEVRERLAQIRAVLNAVPAVEGDLTTRITRAEGSISVELPFGSRGSNAIRPDELQGLKRSLKDVLRGYSAGEYGGDVRIPEVTTLLLYGPDAEALFQLVEPVLSAHPLCAGAVVHIRQGKAHREVVLGAAALTIN